MAGNKNERTLAVLVNGVEGVITVNVEAPLRTVIEPAIRETGQDRGHPVADWTVKDAAGQPLDLARKVGEFDFPANYVLHVELRGGGGGSAC